MGLIIGYISVGLLVGIYSGMLGLGGGLVIIPCLVYFFNVDLKKAIATSLLIIIPTAIVGVLKHYSSGNLDWKVAVYVAIGSAAGAYIGASLVPYIPKEVLKKIFAVVILLISLYMLFDVKINNFFCKIFTR